MKSSLYDEIYGDDTGTYIYSQCPYCNSLNVINCETPLKDAMEIFCKYCEENYESWLAKSLVDGILVIGKDK